METPADFPIDQIARQLKLPADQLREAAALLDEGLSIPFIAQFRLDQTGGMGEGALARLADSLDEYRYLHERRQGLIEYLRGRDALTPEIESHIQDAQSRDRLEQLYSIHKRHRQPKALVDRMTAMGDLLNKVLDGSIDPAEFQKETEDVAAASDLFATVDEVSSALRELVVQRFAQSLPVRELASRILRETGVLNCQRYHADEDQEQHTATVEQVSQSGAAPAEPTTPVEQAAQSGTVPEEPTAAAAQASESGTVPDEPTAPVEQASPSGDEQEFMSGDGSTAPARAAEESTTATVDETSVRTEIEPVAKPTLSVADQRRKRRKESRLRRRAHLEGALREYFNTRVALTKMTPSQFADIEYGERVRVLTATIEFDAERLRREGLGLVVPPDSPLGEMLGAAWEDALKRFIIPDCERAIRRDFTLRTERQSIATLRRHVRNLCMQRPLAERVLAVVGNRDGFSVAVLDKRGEVLAAEDLSRNNFGPEKLRTHLSELVKQHAVTAFAIADTPRTRLIEKIVCESLGEELAALGVSWLVVTAVGLDAYCKSALGCEEIPGVSPEQRAAVTIGRRAQDPLAELVKCSARDWLSDRGQTIVDTTHLEEDLRRVYRSCLGRVGVDLNHAAPAVLRVTLGIDEPTSRKIETQRRASGAIRSLEKLPEIIDLPPKSQQEAMGFLRIYGGENALDGVGIHPDHYAHARQVLEKCDATLEALAQRIEAQRGDPWQEKEQATTIPGDEWIQNLKRLALDEAANELGIGREQLKRIANELRFSARDVRKNSLLPIVRRGGIDVSALKAGELFAGRVVNVASFGAFVEIAQGITGLVHISRLGDRFVRDPRELVTVGEIVPVYVVSVDRERQRIALSFNAPGKERTTSPERSVKKYKPAPRKAKQQDSGPRRTKQRERPRTRKPKVVAPITDAMKKGSEPMRTFGDLKQFYELDQEENQNPNESSEEKKDA